MSKIYHTNPTWRKILNYLNEKGASSTYMICKFCLYVKINGLEPTTLEMQSTYGFLKRMYDKLLLDKSGRVWRVSNKMQNNEQSS